MLQLSEALYPDNRTLDGVLVSTRTYDVTASIAGTAVLQDYVRASEADRLLLARLLQAAIGGLERAYRICIHPATVEAVFVGPAHVLRLPRGPVAADVQLVVTIMNERGETRGLPEKVLTPGVRGSVQDGGDALEPRHRVVLTCGGEQRRHVHALSTRAAQAQQRQAQRERAPADFGLDGVHAFTR